MSNNDRICTSKMYREGKKKQLSIAIEIYNYLNTRHRVYTDRIDWLDRKQFIRADEPSFDGPNERKARNRHSALLSRIRALTRDQELQKRLKFLVNMHVSDSLFLRHDEPILNVPAPVVPPSDFTFKMKFDDNSLPNLKAADDMMDYIACDYGIYEPTDLDDIDLDIDMDGLPPQVDNIDDYFTISC